MGKRSNFEKRDKDKYLTPYAGAVPLTSFLPQRRFTFAEPCAGDGRLIRHIRDVTDNNAQCSFVGDIEPEHDLIPTFDALDIQERHLGGTELIITNPPWTRTKASGYILHRMINHFSDLRPTWLLFDADWLFTKQATPLLERLVCTVAIGRLKWIEGTNMAGKDNCQWAFFRKDAREMAPAPMLFGKGSNPPFPAEYFYEHPYNQKKAA